MVQINFVNLFWKISEILLILYYRFRSFVLNFEKYRSFLKKKITNKIFFNPGIFFYTPSDPSVKWPLTQGFGAGGNFSCVNFSSQLSYVTSHFTCMGGFFGSFSLVTFLGFKHQKIVQYSWAETLSCDIEMLFIKNDSTIIEENTYSWYTIISFVGKKAEEAFLYLRYLYWNLVCGKLKKIFSLFIHKWDSSMPTINVFSLIIALCLMPHLVIP